MNNFDKLKTIRENTDRRSEQLTNAPVVNSESGFRCLHILWLYPDIMNIHGGRGDIMGLIHVSNLMNIPVEVRRHDSLKEDVDWEWAHLVYMTAGELKCASDVTAALKRQMGSSSGEKAEMTGLRGFVERGGVFIANGSSGAVLADRLELCDGTVLEGLGLLHMNWKERESVWGDDIRVKTADGLDVIGNQIQVADVELAEGQEAFGRLAYGRGNNGIAEELLGNGVSRMAGAGSGLEGAKTGNVIYTGILGPLLTKNPRFTESILKNAAETAGIEAGNSLKDRDIEMELKSAEYITDFMEKKQK
ncbi:MAG: hypothetical protein Q4A40_03655 [Bacillota bacterium]|nr:hypothetical protein [Bacillota bacterium]